MFAGKTQQLHRQPNAKDEKHQSAQMVTQLARFTDARIITTLGATSSRKQNVVPFVHSGNPKNILEHAFDRISSRSRSSGLALRKSSAISVTQSTKKPSKETSSYHAASSKKKGGPAIHFTLVSLF